MAPKHTWNKPYRGCKPPLSALFFEEIRNFNGGRCRHLFSHSQDSHCAKQIFFSSLSEVRHVISLVLYIKRYKHGMPARAYIVLHTTACTISTLPPFPQKEKKKEEREKRKTKTNKKTLASVSCSLQRNVRTCVGVKERREVLQLLEII